MSTFGKLLHLVAALGLVLAAHGTGNANVWIDEDFEDTPILSQGNGSAGSGTVDPFDGDTLNTQTGTLITATGSRSTAKAFAGSASYQLSAGQTFAVADGYDGNQHGDWIYFQFAINVDPIPAAAGPIAEWNYSNTLDGTEHVFTINVDADGSGNAVISASAVAGVTPLPPSGGSTIATLSSASDWTFLTVQLGVTGPPQADPRDPAQPPARAAGAYFYASSNTPSVTIPITGAGGKDGNAWSLTVDGATTASVFIDDLYWEAAREDPPSGPSGQANQYLKPFDLTASSSVAEWAMFD